MMEYEFNDVAWYVMLHDFLMFCMLMGYMFLSYYLK